MSGGGGNPCTGNIPNSEIKLRTTSVGLNLFGIVNASAICFICEM